jgi:hypothetical protein
MPQLTISEKLKLLKSLLSRLRLTDGDQHTIEACEMLVSRAEKLLSGDEDIGDLTAGDFMSVASSWHESADLLLCPPDTSSNVLQLPAAS